jgi:hypothetical protein
MILRLDDEYQNGAPTRNMTGSSHVRLSQTYDHAIIRCAYASDLHILHT